MARILPALLLMLLATPLLGASQRLEVNGLSPGLTRAHVWKIRGEPHQGKAQPVETFGIHPGTAGYTNFTRVGYDAEGVVEWVWGVNLARGEAVLARESWDHAKRSTGFGEDRYQALLQALGPPARTREKDADTAVLEWPALGLTAEAERHYPWGFTLREPGKTGPWPR